MEVVSSRPRLNVFFLLSRWMVLFRLAVGIRPISAAAVFGFLATTDSEKKTEKVSFRNLYFISNSQFWRPSNVRILERNIYLWHIRPCELCLWLHMIYLNVIFFIQTTREIFGVRVEKPSERVNGMLLSRRIVNERDQTGLRLTLFQYETCPFCCKVGRHLSFSCILYL